MEGITELTKSDSPMIALLAGLVVVLASVIMYQWKYMQEKTAPKWVWDGLKTKVDKILEVQEKLLTIINERLK